MTVSLTRWFEHRRMSRLRRNEAIAGYLFIMPWIIGFLVWWLGPMLASLYFSFTRYEIITPPQWIGLQNYARLLRDDLFWIALANTALYTVMSVSFYMGDVTICGASA